MVQPLKKRITFRVGKKSAPTPAEASEEETKTRKPGDENEETPVSEVVAEAPPVADSPSRDNSLSSPRYDSSPPRLLPAFVLREGSPPLPLADYDRIRAEAPRLLRGGASTFLRPHRLPRAGAAPPTAPAPAPALFPVPTLDFAYPPKPSSFVVGGGGGDAAAEAASSPLLANPTPKFAYPPNLFLPRFPLPMLSAADWNAEVRRQQLLLAAEEAEDKSLLAEKEPILALAADFPADNLVIQEKIKEQIAESQDEREVFRIFERLEELKKGYLTFGEDEDRFDDCFSDFRNEVINILEERRAGLSLTKLLQENLDEYKSDKVLSFLRLVTSVDMRMREEHFSPFIVDDTNQKSIKEFCENEVLPLGVYADHMQVVALSNAFCIPIRVVYLDSSTRPGGGFRLTHHDFIPVKYEDKFSDLSSLIDGSSSSGSASSSSSSLPRTPVVVLLFRPGHYDILYPK
ncbi:Ubiquitin thioesterase otubain-like [Ananas comosus]|uniref:Ubiquitin thioesterase otubain-like n=1 Tax=Ananas comosus TaxID=4615 RepID=A0A199USW9_ANACO|nr:Ubiquitin thioesterase otubain-like [Ananas comosus]